MARSRENERAIAFLHNHTQPYGQTPVSSDISLSSTQNILPVVKLFTVAVPTCVQVLTVTERRWSLLTLCRSSLQPRTVTVPVPLRVMPLRQLVKTYSPVAVFTFSRAAL